MKKMMYLAVSTLMLSSIAHGQDLLGSLLASQTSPSSSSSSGTPTSSTSVSVPPTSSTSSSVNCLSRDQNSLPLNVVHGLLRTRGAAVKFTHDAQRGELRVRGGEMLSNCNSMLEWTLARPTTDFPQYLVELKVKGCGSEKCSYTVTKKDDAGSIVEQQIEDITPNYDGYKACLKATGVLGDDNKIKPEKIVSRELDTTLNGADVSGKVWFASHGPLASAVHEKTGSSGCYYFEDVQKNGLAVHSVEDSRRHDLDAQAALVCNSGSYRSIADFLGEHTQYEATLGKIRDELILKDMKALAKKLKDGKDLDKLDYSVVDDFERYVVSPLLAKASKLYEELSLMDEGPAKKEYQKQLDKVLADIKALRSAPYPLPKDVDALVAKGLFNEAEKLKSYQLSLQHFTRLGAKEGNVVVTPQVAYSRIQGARDEFEEELEEKRHEHDVKTGQITGKAAFYADLARQHRQNIQTRTQNYQNAINEEIQKLSGGYCNQYFRNTQKCQQNALQTINNLKVMLQQLNQQDAQIAQELEGKAQQYQAWENEGRRYVASQYGEDAPEEDEDDGDNYVSPPLTPPASNSNQWDYSQNQQNPMMFAGQQNPYSMMGQQQPNFMGQQNYQNFNFGGQMQAGGNMFMGQNPYQSMYPQQSQNYGMGNGQWNYGQSGNMYGQNGMMNNNMYGGMNNMYGNNMGMNNGGWNYGGAGLPNMYGTNTMGNNSMMYGNGMGGMNNGGWNYGQMPGGYSPYSYGLYGQGF